MDCLNFYESLQITFQAWKDLGLTKHKYCRGKSWKMTDHNFSETPKQENVELSVTLRVVWKQIIDYNSWRKKYPANGLENLWNLLSLIDSEPSILCQNKFTWNSLF